MDRGTGGIASQSSMTATLVAIMIAGTGLIKTRAAQTRSLCQSVSTPLGCPRCAARILEPDGAALPLTDQ
ncbi:hypothetical protein [Cognatishimia sp. F0-27]|uniref:hypothetical protein n=1 Tax=Cognatishimia sp. F0-27 TaxID=2816855 RepID=UPI001D0C2111|nr:hypothetical protein [Cognatishimia sp. F0-27]MCC1491732.1 hypothetical protein [Cognatishimia sp. F0-27]